jgi:hypothetical protein
MSYDTNYIWHLGRMGVKRIVMTAVIISPISILARRLYLPLNLNLSKSIFLFFYFRRSFIQLKRQVQCGYVDICFYSVTYNGSNIKLRSTRKKSYSYNPNKAADTFAHLYFHHEKSSKWKSVQFHHISLTID